MPLYHQGSSRSTRLTRGRPKASNGVPRSGFSERSSARAGLNHPPSRSFRFPRAAVPGAVAIGVGLVVFVIASAVAISGEVRTYRALPGRGEGWR
jgi:hypothetical protein